MKHLYSALLGAVTSIVGSYFISFASACLGWLHFSEGLWLVYVSLVPSVLAALALSLSDNHVRHTRLIALCVAFFSVALAGSVGAIAVQSARVGFDRVNAYGYFTWCWVYAAVFLPLSYPLARLLQRAVLRFREQPGCAPD